ncbi:MAG: hypothetical protein J1D77_04405 [Muribaculaceae bacterium]|nr:hypothetical protein [Muribaculaceae bacterium]
MASDVRKVIQSISDRWFMTEPLMFAMFCSHQLSENKMMSCGFRSGKRKIEYNPLMLEGFDEVEINELLRREVLRIILKHPYDRQPVNPIRELLYLASNLTIYEHGGSAISPELDSSFEIPHGLSYEEYYNFLLHNFTTSPKEDELLIDNMEEDSEKGDNGYGTIKSNEKQNDLEESGNSPGDGEERDNDDSESSGVSEGLGDEGISDEIDKNKGHTHSFKAPTSFSELHENGKDVVELWENDETEIEYINRCIENAMLTKQWGSVPGRFQDIIVASTLKKDNIRRKLDLFRSSIISTERRLTRMRPSRRYGWQQMGVIHPYVSKLLIGVDTSGSLRSEDLVRFFSIVNTFFTYGIPTIDILQFDVELHFPLLSLKKATKEITIRGRGGTDFQAIIYYYKEHKEYDGLIIFTDGYAPKPKLPPNRKILWVLQDMNCYNDFELNPKVYI